MSEARIRVRREAGGWRDRARSYKILLDGAPAGSIKRGETVALETEPGNHSLQLKLDWGQSPTTNLNLSPGDDIEVTCGPNGSSLAALYAITFGRTRYIALRVSSSNGPAGSDHS